jgi:hypothetical protein
LIVCSKIFSVCRRQRPRKENVENGDRQENIDEAKRDNETDSQEKNTYLGDGEIFCRYTWIGEHATIKETMANNKGGSRYREGCRSQEPNYIYFRRSRRL